MQPNCSGSCTPYEAYLMPSVLLIDRVYVLKVNGSGEKSPGVPKIGHFFEVTFWADPAKVDVRSLTNHSLYHTYFDRSNHSKTYGK